MKLKIVKFAFWLQGIAEKLLERFDACCYAGCKNQADHWCITGGHRHCYEHESGFYSDVEFCQACYDSMTPEERAREIEECKAEEFADDPA